MKLRDWPEFDLIRPAGANRLIVGFKTVRTIAPGQDLASGTENGWIREPAMHLRFRLAAAAAIRQLAALLPVRTPCH